MRRSRYHELRGGKLRPDIDPGIGWVDGARGNYITPGPFQKVRADVLLHCVKQSLGEEDENVGSNSEAFHRNPAGGKPAQ